MRRLLSLSLRDLRAQKRFIRMAEYETTDDDARAATMRDRERVLELNKLRAPLYYGHNDAVRGVIKDTILRLPYEAQQFAFADCVFFSFAFECAGHSFSAEAVARKWIVWLSPLVPIEDLAGVIAHEIAHGLCGLSKDKENDERKVEWLAREWGFSEPTFAPAQWFVEQYLAAMERLRSAAVSA